MGRQDALRLREEAHKLYGTLSAFSTVAGDQAADLEDLAARTQLADAAPMSSLQQPLDRVTARGTGRTRH